MSGANTRGNWKVNKDVKNNKSPGEDKIQAELLKKEEKKEERSRLVGYGI